MQRLMSISVFAVMLTMGCALNAGVRDASAAQPYHWYDGDKKRTVYLDETMIADFNPRPDTAAKAASASGLSAGRTVSGVRLWKVSSGSATLALKTVRSRDLTGKYSPVFRDGWTTGQMRALPGNVIVQFASEWDEARINKWVSDQGQSIDRKASFGTNFYILATPPGIASLEIANALFETGDVLLASPNWWQEPHLK